MVDFFVGGKDLDAATPFDSRRENASQIAKYKSQNAKYR
jgi:hypothetical protein